MVGLLPLCPVGRVCVCLSVCDVPLGMVGSQVSPVSCFQFLCLNPSLSSHSLISRFNFLNTPCGLQPLAWIFKGRQPGPGAWSRLGTRELSGGAGAPAPPVIRSNPRAVQAPPPSPHRTLGSQEPAGLTEVDWSGLPCPPPGNLPNPGMEPKSPALQADPLPLHHLGCQWVPCKLQGTSYCLAALTGWEFSGNWSVSNFSLCSQCLAEPGKAQGCVSVFVS